ncbi:transglycosylase domain-containing protein [Merdibacter massiliensis]|uniref:transglycosylase domain-containing protein n=1 Tax=Merdibacter massiliensis TaxID=1871030 RepID=UPI00096A725D|nr:transglycosylase domain-containing protein [Merdibacter massiliensis]
MKNKEKKEQNAVQKKSKWKRLDAWNKAAIFVLTLVLVGCVCVFTLLVNVISEAPNFNPEQLVAGTSSRVYDKDGNVIAELGSEHRDNITYEDLPQDLIDAFLAIEDSRFFKHNGFDLPRFLSSAINNLSSGSLSQGGSTLTMQLVDNTWIANAKTQVVESGGSVSAIDNIKYKIQEIYLSLLTEQSMDKKQILVNYLNMIWFGSDGGTRGVQNAALYYFGKDVNELNLSECAFLAGVINAPGAYTPYNLAGDDIDHYSAATKRRNETLALMLQHGYISKEEYNLSKSTNLAFQLEKSDTFTEDPYQSIVELAVKETRELTGLDPYTTEMDIYTGIDSEAQKLAYELSTGKVYSFPNQYFNVGLTLLNNKTGEIVAIGPGREYTGDSSSRNAATEDQQPGSTMKPILDYAPTFEYLGWSTSHTVDDKADDYFHIGRDLQNSDGKYMGKMSLADALGLSRNTTAAATLQLLIDSQGSNFWVSYLKNLGFRDSVAEAFDIQYSIGGGNMRCSTIELANAYSTLANGGTREDAHVIRSVSVRNGKTYEYKTKSTEVLSEGAAYMMSTILEKVVNGGYASFNYILDGDGSYTVYGKSGTTDWGTSGAQYGIPTTAMKDEWSVSYTSEYTVTVWSGYTSTGIEHGYYITEQVLYEALASHINRAMLDSVSDSNTAPLSKPSSVVSTASGDGGLILSKYYDTEESKTNGMADDPSGTKREEEQKKQEKCKDDPLSDESCDGYEEAMKQLQTKCQADPTIDKRCDGYEDAMKKKQEQQSCEASGGTYQNGQCITTVPPTTQTPSTDGSTSAPPSSDDSTSAPPSSDDSTSAPSA